MSRDPAAAYAEAVIAPTHTQSWTTRERFFSYGRLFEVGGENEYERPELADWR